jgi:flagellar biosynthetic protein FliR
MAIQIGLSGAALLDPVNQHQVPALGQLMQLMALAFMLGLDLHLVMLDALAASVHLVPVGAPLDTAAGLAALVQTGGTLFVLGLRFAAPVIAAVLVANVALAALSRAAPQLNILQLAFPVQIAIGLLTLLASIPVIATVLGEWAGTYDGLLGGVLRALGGG